MCDCCLVLKIFAWFVIIMVLAAMWREEIARAIRKLRARKAVKIMEEIAGKAKPEKPLAETIREFREER